MIKNLIVLAVALFLTWATGENGNPDRGAFYMMTLTYLVLNVKSDKKTL
ncbi:hypothetical protein AB1L07_02515 [Niallia alba]